MDGAGEGAATWIYLPELALVLVGALALAVEHQHSFARAAINCSDILILQGQETLTISVCLCFE